jgi:hypothetical protein
MRSLSSAHSLVLVALVALVALGGAGCPAAPPTPGFAPDAVPDGPRLVLDAALADDGTHATITVTAADVPELFGVSFHVALTGGATLAHAKMTTVLGDDDAAVHVAAIHGADAALGGTRVDPALGDVALRGALATVDAAANGADTSELRLTRVLAKSADGQVVPLAFAGGVITWSAP